MACDLQGTIGGIQKIKLNTKIFKFNPHELVYDGGEFIVGFAGSADEFMEVVDFYTYPEHYKKVPNMRFTSGLVLTARKELFYFSHPGKWMRVKEKFYAVGSGAPTALGALHAGATPKEAVLAASKVDPSTGMGTKVLKF